MKISIDLKTAEGKTADAMRQIIDARRRELGETTRKSCVALAINVLKSIRADTKVANEKKMNITIDNVDSQFFPDWKKNKGEKKARRILRSGENGHEVNPDRVVWRTEKYRKGEKYHTFKIIDKIAENKEDKYLIVCKDEKTAKEYAKHRHIRNAKTYKGLAKLALGIAMHKTHDAEKTATATVTQKARQTGFQNAEVRITERGFNSGDVSIFIHDKLNYATLALKHGEGYVQNAVDNALRSMLGYLTKKTKNADLKKSLKTTLEELKKI